MSHIQIYFCSLPKDRKHPIFYLFKQFLNVSLPHCIPVSNGKNKAVAADRLGANRAGIKYFIVPALKQTHLLKYGQLKYPWAWKKLAKFSLKQINTMIILVFSFLCQIQIAVVFLGAKHMNNCKISGLGLIKLKYK